jgi:hypothetical protein
MSSRRSRSAGNWTGKTARRYGGCGLYYYLMTMAKCLEALGVDEVTDTDGNKHDWLTDLTTALARGRHAFVILPHGPDRGLIDGKLAEAARIQSEA